MDRFFALDGSLTCLFEVGAVKGGVISEAYSVGCRHCGFSLEHELLRHGDALCREIGENGGSVLLLECVAEIVFTYKKLLCELVQGKLFGGVLIQIFGDAGDGVFLVLFAVGGRGKR